MFSDSQFICDVTIKNTFRKYEILPFLCSFFKKCNSRGKSFKLFFKLSVLSYLADLAMITHG